MTCIVGLVENGITWLGGDSLASNGYTQFTTTDKKVFKMKDSNNMVLGFSGSIRDLNLLNYASNLIDNRDEPNINHEYIVTKFVPNVMKLMNDNGRNINDKGINEQESYFLLAYKDKLWTIHFDYSVNSTENNYDAIGCGFQFALGSLKTTEDINMKPVDRIHKALQAASKFSVGVAPPFYIINTKDDEVIEFNE